MNFDVLYLAVPFVAGVLAALMRGAVFRRWSMVRDRWWLAFLAGCAATFVVLIAAVIVGVNLGLLEP